MNEMDRTISPSDEMYAYDPENYFSWGPAAVRAILRVMEGASEIVPPPIFEERRRDLRILDFACGHGRVMRALKHAFPDAQLTAADTSRGGVDFCARTFGARPLYASEDPSEIQTRERFDLIWCGSLFTHVDSDRWNGLLDFFEEHLERWGILVFTTHGRLYAEKVLHDHDGLGLSKEGLSSVLEQFAESGFGYESYPEYPNYGISLSSPGWIYEFLKPRPALRLVWYGETGWNGFQDVMGCVRLGAAAAVDMLLASGREWTERELSSVTRYPEKEISRALEALRSQRQEEGGERPKGRPTRPSVP